jgi:hypothetical protein
MRLRMWRTPTRLLNPTRLGCALTDVVRGLLVRRVRQMQDQWMDRICRVPGTHAQRA